MGAPPNSLPPLPIQGGSQPTPATPDAPLSGVMNFIKAIGSGLSNMGTGGASGMQKEREGFAQKQSQTAEATGLAEQQAQAGQPIDIAAFVAAGGNPQMGQWLAETAKQKAAQNAQFTNAIGAIPNLDDRTRATIQAGFASGDPKQEELSKMLLASYASQAKNEAGIKERKITAQGGVERAKVSGQYGLQKEREATSGALQRERESTAGALQRERENNAVKLQLEKVKGTAKKGGADSIAKSEAKLSTAYKQTLKPDADGNYTNIDNYNNTTVQSLPFKNAVNNYMFKDADGKPITQPGITGAANTFFGDKKAAAGFLNTFNTDI